MRCHLSCLRDSYLTARSQDYCSLGIELAKTYVPLHLQLSRRIVDVEEETSPHHDHLEVAVQWEYARQGVRLALLRVRLPRQYVVDLPLPMQILVHPGGILSDGCWRKGINRFRGCHIRARLHQIGKIIQVTGLLLSALHRPVQRCHPPRLRDTQIEGIGKRIVMDDGQGLNQVVELQRGKE